ncbi:MAG: response regulator, partial [Deltaproteobacteria bacterium]
PLFVGHLAGARAALGWTVAAVGVLALAVWLPPLAVAEPAAVGADVMRLLGLGGLVAVVFAFTVTARRTSERQVAAIVARERHIREQARALELARDAAIDAVRVKSDFLANMSHEVRTPLNGVVGMTALLARTPLDDGQAHMVRTLERSGRALLAIVDEILDLSKIESGGIRIAHAPWSVRRVIEEVAALAAPIAADKGLELITEVDDDVPTNLMGDGARVRQVLHNLVGNAIKFTDRGRVSVHATLDRDDTLRIEVRDTGVGIPEDKLSILFDAFTQLSDGSPRRHGGTGLGLTIARHLARMLGGELEVRSQVGAGSVFVLTLPLERSTRERYVSDVAPTVDPTLGERYPLAILVAEDTEVSREVVVGMLAAFGYDADVAVDGEEVLAAVGARAYDLILMDLRMPGIDGLEATRRIRAELPRDRQPRIFALTANVLPEHRVRAREAGMDGFIGKPVSFDDIGTALAACGAGAGLVVAPATPPPTEASPLPAPLAKLLFVLGGEPTRLSGLIAKHLGQADALVSGIEAALAAGDLTTAERNAHSLKSSSAMFGSMRVSQLSARLEAAAAARDDADCARCLGELRRASAAASAELQVFAR